MSLLLYFRLVPSVKINKSASGMIFVLPAPVSSNFRLHFHLARSIPLSFPLTIILVFIAVTPWNALLTEGATKVRFAPFSNAVSWNILVARLACPSLSDTMQERLSKSVKSDKIRMLAKNDVYFRTLTLKLLSPARAEDAEKASTAAKRKVFIRGMMERCCSFRSDFWNCERENFSTQGVRE